MHTQPLWKTFPRSSRGAAPPAADPVPRRPVAALPQLLIEFEDFPHLLDTPRFRRRFNGILLGQRLQDEIKNLLPPYHPKLINLLRACLPFQTGQAVTTISHIHRFSKIIGEARGPLRALAEAYFVDECRLEPPEFDAAVIQQLDDRAVSLLFWSYANLNMVPPMPALPLLLDRVAQLLPTTSALSLSLLVWSFGRTRLELAPRMYPLLYQAIRARAPEFSAQSLGNVLLACSRLQRAPPAPVLKAIAAASLPKTPEMTVGTVTELMTAFARLNTAPPSLLYKQLSQRVTERVHRLPTSSITQLLGAICTLKLQAHRKLIAALMEASEQKLSKWELVEFEDSCARLQQLGAKLSPRMLAAAKRSPHYQAPPPPPSADPESLANAAAEGARLASGGAGQTLHTNKLHS
jgi:hypothetical protein